jgi:small GTP-binding protein
MAERKVKCLFIGAPATGKTCLIYRLNKKAFLDTAYVETIGVAFVKLAVEIGGSPARLELWDTPGVDFSAVLPSSLVREAAFCIGVFSPDQKDSFPFLRSQLEEIAARNSPQWRVVIVENKADLLDMAGREEEKAQLANLSGAEGWRTFLTSARTEEGTADLLNYIIRTAASNDPESEPKPGGDRPRPATTGGGYCC